MIHVLFHVCCDETKCCSQPLRIVYMGKEQSVRDITFVESGHLSKFFCTHDIRDYYMCVSRRVRVCDNKDKKQYQPRFGCATRCQTTKFRQQFYFLVFFSLCENDSSSVWFSVATNGRFVCFSVFFRCCCVGGRSRHEIVECIVSPSCCIPFRHRHIKPKWPKGEKIDSNTIASHIINTLFQFQFRRQSIQNCPSVQHTAPDRASSECICHFPFNYMSVENVRRATPPHTRMRNVSAMNVVR